MPVLPALNKSIYNFISFTFSFILIFLLFINTANAETAIGLNNPINASVYNSTSVIFGFTANHTSNSTISNCSLWGNFSGSWAVNQTKQSGYNYTYQEDPNAYYYDPSQWAYGERVIDQSWSNWAWSILNNTNVYYYLNYTPPLGSSAGLWQIRDWQHYDNLTLPNLCFNNPIQLRILSFYVAVDYNWIQWQCWNGSDWYNIRQDTCYGIPCSRVAEEAIYWNYTQVTNATQTNFTAVNLNPGNYIWNVQCFDNYSNSFFALSNFTTKIDHEIRVNITTPVNAGILEINKNLFNFTLMLGSGATLENCSLWTNASGTWAINQTLTKNRLSDGLILDLRLDINSTNQTDSSGNQYHGNVTGARWTNNSRFGDGAYAFDGDGDRIFIQKTFNDTDGNFSFGGWFKTNSTAIQQYLLSCFGPGSRTEIDFYLLYLGYYSIGIQILNQSNPVRFNLAWYPFDNFSINNWYHYFVTFENNATNSTMILYINGTNVSKNIGLPITNILCNTSHLSGGITWYPFEIGSLIGIMLPFNGSIDDIKIYNKTLSAGDVKSLYLSSNYFANNSVINFNETNFAPGQYKWNIRCVDNESDIYTNSINFTLTLTDTTKPYFIHSLKNHSYINKTNWYYDINATDNFNMANYTVNDTTNFKISSAGILTNNTDLAVGIYSLNISINDTSGNDNSSIIFIKVSTNRDPEIINYSFTENLKHNLSYYGTNIAYASINITISDDDGDSVSFCNFSIRKDSSVLFLNSNGSRNGNIWYYNFNTSPWLTPGEYFFNVTCDDNNSNSGNASIGWSMEYLAPVRVELLKPLNHSKTESIVEFNATILIGSADAISTCQLWLNTSGTMTLNQSNSSGIINGSTITFKVNFGSTSDFTNHYNWTINCSDNSTGLTHYILSHINDRYLPAKNRLIVRTSPTEPTNVDGDLINQSNLPGIPKIPQQFKFNMSSNYYYADDNAYAYLDLYAPNGSKVIISQRGTKYDNGKKFTWDWYNLTNNISPGKWIWNITVVFNTGLAGRDSGYFYLNNSNTFGLDMIPSLTNIRFNNVFNFSFWGQTYDYNFAHVNLSLIAPNGSTITSWVNVSNSSINEWRFNYSKATSAGTWIMRAAYKTYSGEPSIFNETFSLTDNIHYYPDNWTTNTISATNETLQVNISIWLDTNETESILFGLNINESEWFEKLNVTPQNADLNNSLNMSFAYRVNITVQGNASMKAGIFRGNFTMNRSSKGDNNITYMPITLYITTAGGQIHLAEYYDRSLACNTTDYCKLESNITNQQSTNKRYFANNTGNYRIRDCSVTVGPSTGGTYSFTNLDTSLAFNTFDLEIGEGMNFDMLINKPTAGSYESRLNIICTDGTAEGYSNSLVASNRPLVKLEVTSAAEEPIQGGGGGGGAPSKVINVTEVKEIIEEKLREEKMPTFNIDDLIKALWDKEARQRLMTEGGVALILLLFLAGITIFVTITTRKEYG